MNSNSTAKKAVMYSTVEMQREYRLHGIQMQREYRLDAINCSRHSIRRLQWGQQWRTNGKEENKEEMMMEIMSSICRQRWKGWWWGEDTEVKGSACRWDDLMEFLARYVRFIHEDRYYKSLLIVNCGLLYWHNVVSFIMNSNSVWLKRRTADGDLMKPLYTLGKGVKHVYGVTA